MAFHSLEFLAFFALVWALSWSLATRWRLRNGVLLAASWVFYGFWDARFLGLIALSTVVDWAVGLALDRARGARARRALLVTSVAVNLGILGFFKYWNFFVSSAQELLGSLGLHTGDGTLQLVLPVGVSFYTFQTLSYTIDRYRGQVAAVRNPVDFAFFVSFFPQLVAGPIVRAREFLPQALAATTLRASDQALGLRLVLWGLFQKVVVADNLAPFVDAVFAADEGAAFGLRLLALHLFAVQIYCDFSGYSDIARGTARMLGFRFPRNFRAPYLSSDPSSFWRRWHITLSTWLRDYLYLPLGGNRGGRWRTYRNLMLTMLLGGLWHGAAWTFVVWGAYQGLLLVGHRLWCERRDGRGASRAPRAPVAPGALGARLQHLVFLELVVLGWLPFRAESFAQLGRFLLPGGAGLGQVALDEAAAVGLLVGLLATGAVLLWDLVLARGDEETALERLRPAGQALVCAGLYLSISFLGRFGGDSFLYFQF